MLEQTTHRATPHRSRSTSSSSSYVTKNWNSGTNKRTFIIPLPSSLPRKVSPHSALTQHLDSVFGICKGRICNALGKGRQLSSVVALILYKLDRRDYFKWCHDLLAKSCSFCKNRTENPKINNMRENVRCSPAPRAPSARRRPWRSTLNHRTFQNFRPLKKIAA